MFNIETFMDSGRKKLLVLMLVLSVSQLYGATTRNDIKLNEASEDIKLLSQKIVKDYLYLSLSSQKKEIVDSINNSVTNLDGRIRLIASVTKSADAKDILSFLVFSRDEIGEILKEEYSVDNALIMLDNSEVLIEGADSIASENSYKFSKEEKMYIKIKYMSFLVQRIAKYYMAIQAGFDDEFIVQQLKLSVKSFDKELEKLKRYGYDKQAVSDLKALESYWSNTKAMFLTLNKKKLPNVLYISSQEMDDLLEKLKLYHSKNQ